METSTPTASGGETIREAAAASVTPDQITADLLAKRSAGQPLSAAEYGKLGAWAYKLKRLFKKDGADNGQTELRTKGGNAVDLEPISPDETSGDGLAMPSADADLVRRTTESILKTAEDIARRKVARHGADAGADAKTLTRLDAAARIPSHNRELMVDTSPQVAEALGFNPKHYPIATFIGAAGLWLTGIWLAIDELKEMKKEKAPAPEKEKKPVPTIFSGPVVNHEPKQPKGAPPEVN